MRPDPGVLHAGVCEEPHTAAVTGMALDGRRLSWSETDGPQESDATRKNSKTASVRCGCREPLCARRSGFVWVACVGELGRYAGKAMWFWLLPFVLCAPWIVGIAWMWSRLPDDGWMPPSMGSHVRQQILQPPLGGRAPGRTSR